MSRKVEVYVRVKLVLDIDKTSTVESVLENMDYAFIPDPDEASFVDSEIVDWVVTNSK